MQACCLNRRHFLQSYPCYIATLKNARACLDLYSPTLALYSSKDSSKGANTQQFHPTWYIQICIVVFTCIHICIQICTFHTVYVHMYIYIKKIHIYMCVMYVCDLYIYMYIRNYVYMYIYICIHLYIHTYSTTQNPKWAASHERPPPSRDSAGSWFNS